MTTPPCRNGTTRYNELVRALHACSKRLKALDVGAVERHEALLNARAVQAWAAVNQISRSSAAVDVLPLAITRIEHHEHRLVVAAAFCTLPGTADQTVEGKKQVLRQHLPHVPRDNSWWTYRKNRGIDALALILEDIIPDRDPELSLAQRTQLEIEGTYYAVIGALAVCRILDIPPGPSEVMHLERTQIAIAIDRLVHAVVVLDSYEVKSSDHDEVIQRLGALLPYLEDSLDAAAKTLTALGMARNELLSAYPLLVQRFPHTSGHFAKTGYRIFRAMHHAARHSEHGSDNVIPTLRQLYVRLAEIPLVVERTSADMEQHISDLVRLC